MSLIDELKRRNVLKVTGAYLALGWMIVEMSGTAVPALHLPDWTTSLLLWIGLAGLPFVIAFAWVFELTPEGVKRASEIDPSQSIARHTGRRLDYVIIAMLGIAMLMFAADRLLPRDAPLTSADAPPVGRASARLQPDVGLKPDLQSDLRRDSGADPSAAPALDDKSIAVLPFVNMSSDQEQEYFSDGMSEELLNLLAKAPDLKVIARTSSFAFKGTNTPIAEIARQLGVAHVLEGSVRKSGNTVRITAQLIRAVDSTHLWSETYDRPMDDIFKVQDEIAGAIAGALQIKLAGGALSRREGGTQNLEAYRFFLRAISANQQNTRLALETSGGYLEQAIKLDPNYGLAWAALSENFANKADGGFLGASEGYDRARQLAQHALQLSPDSAYAHTRLQYVYLNFDWDWAAAEQEGRRAFALNSRNPEVLKMAGIQSLSLGRWADSEQQLRAVLVRDPLNTYAHWHLGYSYYGASRFADAERIFRKLLALEPGFTSANNSLGQALLAQGKAEEALAVVQQQPDAGERLKLLPVFLHAAGRQAEEEETTRAQIARWDKTAAYFVAVSFAYRGEHDRAIEWLERAYTQKDPFLGLILGEQLFSSISTDPRYKAFLRKMNLPETPPG